MSKPNTCSVACPIRSALALLIAMIVTTALTAGASTGARADATSIPVNSKGCLDLAAYLGNLRQLPDELSVHRVLLDLEVRAAGAGNRVSDLAQQQALDLFFHPDLTTQGLAAAKNGTGLSHVFKAYQYDCKKVITGDIFSDMDLAVTWEIASSDANSLMLKRLTQGGDVEASKNLTLVVRGFRAITPTIFMTESLYALKTRHFCAESAELGVPTSTDEVAVVIATEAYLVDEAGEAPALPVGDGLAELFKKHPRVAAANGRRGEFATPVTAQTDSACKKATPVLGAPVAFY